MNDNLIEGLGWQIQSGDYEQIYNESSRQAKDHKYSEAEFMARMKSVVERMREVDESLTMQKHKSPYADEGAFPPSRYAYRYVEKNEKRIGIKIMIDSSFGASKLLDFCIYTEKVGTNENPANDVLCVSDIGDSL
jgi:hypothetical protein